MSTTIVAKVVIRFFPCVFYELHPVEAFAHSVRNHVDRPCRAAMDTTLLVTAMMEGLKPHARLAAVAITSWTRCCWFLVGRSAKAHNNVQEVLSSPWRAPSCKSYSL